MGKNRGQTVTLFVIIALVFVGGIAGYFAVQKGLLGTQDTESFSAVYQYYDQCVQQALQEGVELAGLQGGWIYVPDYIEGSTRYPSGSQLSFLGQGIPYWLYVSGNGQLVEQVPTKTQMEQGIARYIKEEVALCDFGPLYVQEYEIGSTVDTVTVRVGEGTVDAVVKGELLVARDGQEARVSSRSYSEASQLGALYLQALAWYQSEKESALLENYTRDVLVNYAPVDGVEVKCGPQVWETRKVVDTLREGISANLGALSSERTGYFKVVGEGTAPVRFMSDSSWPGRVEIYGEGVSQEVMLAQPIGTQQGLGALGFCYVPYHFVYDIVHPVLVQFGEGDGDLFQFPLILVIDKNLPRQGLSGEIEQGPSQDLCLQLTEELSIRVSDVALEPVLNVTVSYSCFDQECRVGEGNGVVQGKAPGCVNGQLVVRAPGYQEKSLLFSSTEEEEADIILDKTYPVRVALFAGGKEVGETGIVSFHGTAQSTAVVPSQTEVSLVEGLYNVSVLVYGNTSIQLEASTTQQCVDVPIGGIGGLFGGTKEQCFSVTIPASTVEYALLGGGESTVYLFPADLEDGQVRIDIPALQKPTSLTQLQTFYDQFTTQSAMVTP
ncbi:hypothetical protein EXS73_01285 [Candidatus Pacearchaeota archaeon]|nr:hypothetical protein [Candidatus Pacearchaeota archaeon]